MSILAVPGIRRHYSGGLLRELMEPARPGRLTALDSPPGTADELVAAALGVDGLYPHQQEIVNAIRKGEDLVAALPFGSGRTTACLVATLPGCVAKGKSLLIVTPDGALADDFQRGANGLLRRARIDWLVQVETLGSGNRAPLLPGSVVVASLEALHEALRPGGRVPLREWLPTLSTVIVDVPEGITGARAAHLAGMLGRLRAALHLQASSPSWVLLAPPAENAAEFASALGMPSDAKQVFNDTAPASERQVSLWSTVVTELDLVSKPRGPSGAASDSPATVRGEGWTAVHVKREGYWQELVRVAAGAVADGRVVAILSGEVHFARQNRKRVEQEVFRIGESATGGVPTGRVVAADSLDGLKAELEEAGLGLAEVDVLVLCGLEWPPGMVELNTRHIRKSGTLDLVLLAPRTPYYQYLSDHPEALGFGGGERRAGLDELPGLRLSLPAPGKATWGYHGAFFAAEVKQAGGQLADLDGIVPGPLLEDHQTTSSALDLHPTFDCHTSDVVQVVDDGTGKAIAWFDRDVAPVLVYENAVIVLDGTRYAVNGWDVPAGSISASPEGSSFVTARSSATEFKPVTGTGPQPREIRTRGFRLSLGQMQVSERVVGRRAYAYLDFEREDRDAVTFGRSVERTFSAPVLSFEPVEEVSEEVIHGLAHVLRSALWIASGHANLLRVVADGASIRILDETGFSLAALQALFNELKVLRLLERSLAILAACPCDRGCAGCISDWSCLRTDCSKWSSGGPKREVAAYLGKLLEVNDSLPAKATMDQGLSPLVRSVLRIMKEKLRARVEDPYQVSFWDSGTKEHYERELGRGLAGLCVSGKNQIFIEPGLSEAATQDIAAHELFHNYQFQGGMHRSLRYYNPGDIDDSRNVPFQGKLWIEGSATWAAVIVSDYWAATDRVHRNTLSGSNEYLEGYRAVAEIHRDRGVVRTLDFLRDDHDPQELDGVYKSSRAWDDIQSIARNCALNGELKCQSGGYCGRLPTSIVTPSHYLARTPPRPLLPGEERRSRWALLWTVVAPDVRVRGKQHGLGSLSVGDFLDVYGPYGAQEILNEVFSPHYQGQTEVPCGGCASRQSERLDDACIIHKGIGLLGLRPGLWAVLRWKGGFETKSIRMKLFWRMIRRFGVSAEQALDRSANEGAGEE